MTKTNFDDKMSMLAFLIGGILLQKPTLIDELMVLSDEDLVCQSKKSEIATTIIISRYSKLIYKKAHSRSRFDYEVDDLIQEGLMALISAVGTYDKSHGAKFSTYANVCITNRMTNTLLKSNLNDKIDTSIDEIENDFTTITPESILLEKEKTQELYTKIINILSDKEWKVFCLFLTGSTYDQMARQLNLPLKVVDNAMQRVRRKLKTVWRADNFN